MSEKVAVIIGAGPAGLTAAYELLARTDIKPIIYESSSGIGGLAKTVNYGGNRIDTGGHRFFSKSDRIMQWWLHILPLEASSEKTDKVMLLRQRISRILFERKFFNYPLSLNKNTISNLGLSRLLRIILSYLRARFFPIREEKSLEDFFINRFGKELYSTFFKDYTEKVWGVPCHQIKPEWGAQRIKGISITKVVLNALKKYVATDTSIGQRGTETSLIERFLYPKFGPGQLWEEVARLVQEKGGKLYLNHHVLNLCWEGKRITGVKIRNMATAQIIQQSADYFFSTMPIKDLILGLKPSAPDEVFKVANGLCYRDFIIVGLLLKRLRVKNETKIKTENDIIPDNWIYIQEKDVKIGRVQIFNNWSPYMVEQKNTVWIGLEYFCNEGDELWEKSDQDFIDFAINETIKIGFIERQDVLDSTLLRVPKTYPAYFGTYDQFLIIRNFTDTFENLFLVGRNGMHRYNNQDHSMLTAMKAVENVLNGIKEKDNIWSVNVETQYHEEKTAKYP